MPDPVQGDPLAPTWQKAATIGAPQGNWTPLPTAQNGWSLNPLDWPLTGLVHAILGNAKQAPDRGPAFDDPATVRGMVGAIDPGEALDALASKFPRTAAAIKAYHGSPHDFEKFDLSKIGTGEGAQAYGHGLYFAENPETAKAYRDALPPVTVHGERVGVEVPHAASSPQTLAKSALAATNGDPADAIGRLLQYSDALGRQPFPGMTAEESQAPFTQAMQHVREWAQSGAIGKGTGKTYEVAIKAHPDQFMDWDKPITEQSDAVRAALKSAGASDWIMQDSQTPAGLRYQQATRNSLRAADLFQGGKGDLETTAADVSGRLKDAGIKGIKYLDQGSRGSGQGTSNYVVFDDALIDILKKYGIALPFAGSLLHQPQGASQ